MVGQPVPGNLSRIQDPQRTPHGVAMAGAGRARPAPRTEGRHLALRPAALRTRDGSGGSAGDMLRLCRVISHICRFLALARLTLAEPDGLVR